MLMNLSSSFNLFLDDTGIFYLSYFEENVANLLSISPKSSNYFLKTFFTLSVTSESISNLLAAWGALFHQDSDLAVVNKYINRARASIKQNPTDRFDYFITMAYYLITIGIQVCSGDTSNWYQLFNKCEDLMRRYGGFLKFIKDFDYSNDCKFLIANFQFHDIMSSEALMKGTTCSMNSYNDLFKINKLLELDNYGIDPYQGCIQPIYLLLGEIMNNYVELKGERVKLNEKLNGDIIVEDPASLNFLRLDHFKKIDEKFFELTDKINYCSPIESQLQQLDSDGERAAHMKLFDLYKITCKMYLSLYIKQTQPISGEIQNHLVTALTLIHDLIKTDLISSLNMSLLICGISCCSKFDRMQLDATFDKVYSRYHVGNVKRIWDVVKEAWKRNASGNTCIDWIDICNDFGWKLSMC
ncbi:transcriptional activator, Zn-finger [Scheffersomyces xylosifermentans]|uniref:transcriptional activator, Zn-finger n=1 Tax=Scheffersomyces xylosifermentans TaxID=1304137 RepID=UPI00315D8B29